MADTATIEAPPQTIPTTPAAPAAKPAGAVVPPPVEPPGAPKPGSARAKMFEDLRKKAKTPGAVEPETPAAPAKPAAPAQEELGEDLETPEEGKAPEAKTSEPPKTPEEKKKVSPWKLVDQFKQRALEAESKLAEATKGMVSEEQRKQAQEQFESVKKRAEELEQEIRYVNYSKSREFQEKYQVPYEKAWERAMSELKELTVTDASGNPRQVQASDILELVNLPLAKAREAAVQAFGDFADDVMGHRKEIRNLYEAQAAALEEAKKNGLARDKQRSEMFQQFREKVGKEISETWKQANDAALKHDKYGKYFTPAEGDEEGNTRLQKGFELVDKAFAENPYAPNLTPDERAAIIKRHAAVRNRAAAFSRLVHQVSKLEARNEELAKELAQFKQSQPPTQGTQPQGQPTPSSARETVMAGLRKYAK